MNKIIAETKIGKNGKIDFSDYKKQVDSLKDHYAISQIVKKLLKNVIETGRENKIKNIVYNYDFYEGEE